MANVIDGDLIVRGNVKANSVNIPANTIGNTEFSSIDPLAADKQEHQFVRTYAQVQGVDSTTQRMPIHVAFGATGTVVAFRVGAVIVPTVDKVATFDLLKNGTTVLSGTVTITASDSNFSVKVGSISGPSYVAGDVFEVSVTISGATGNNPRGVFASVIFREEAEE